jgi:CDGSH-type Zn-finger protein
MLPSIPTDVLRRLLCRCGHSPRRRVLCPREHERAAMDLARSRRLPLKFHRPDWKAEVRRI